MRKQNRLILIKSLLLTSFFTVNHLAHAVIVPDHCASESPAPQIYTEGQTTVIDIANPVNGVSTSHFKQFDITPKEVVVLNNSYLNGEQVMTYITSNQAATIPTEKTSNQADMIVAQVHGEAMSELRGQLLVAGAPAEVVICNPHGVKIVGLKTAGVQSLLTSYQPISAELAHKEVSGYLQQMHSLGKTASITRLEPSYSVAYNVTQNGKLAPTNKTFVYLGMDTHAKSVLQSKGTRVTAGTWTSLK